ncbi:MAG: bifunctional diaminohydroxyphosphoribosylaminopyrimidine deaminase/5-amino-6-(5-phosphoribosylamino)uracil reductase RibD [Bacillota bacterium]
MSFSEQDRHFMAAALKLAARGRSRTHPNPMVGCVIVKEGAVIGTGYHRKAGEPHAEVYALQEAGESARGATAYVTLEPCAHHGRTPPCADALIAAGVARVVAAMVDPDPRTAGQGLERLRAAGIQAEVGLLEQEAEALNRSWLTWKRTGRPFVILKWAMTLDGKIACASGDSRWVTGDAARAHLHQIRDQVDAILVGETTARRDDPELTARPTGPGPLPGWAGGIDPGPDEHWQPKDPLRIVLDSMAKTDLNARLFAPELMERPLPNKTLIAATQLASPRKLAMIRERGAETLELPEREQVVALAPLLDELGRRGITSLLVEGGGRIHWSFLSQGLADHLMVYVAPKVVGGATAPGPVAGQGLKAMAEAWELVDRIQVTPIGEDLLLEGDLRKG